MPHKAALHKLKVLLWPHTCAACNAFITSTAEENTPAICPSCWQNLPFWNTETEPLPILPEDVNSFHAPFLYQETVRRMVLNFKFHDNTYLTQTLATFMRHSMPEALTEQGLLIVPVPVHWSRLFTRRYNQSAKLAHALAKRLDIPCNLSALKRRIPTQHQTGKSAAKRKKLLKSAFCVVNSKKVEGRTILLIDDVWTTGSTVAACAKKLKEAGAAEIHVLTVAYTPPQ